MWKTILVPILLIITSLSITSEAKRPDVALWLARSCVGEVDWDSYSSGECAAIMHVHAKRALIAREPLLKVSRRYSAAIKAYPGRTRNWVLTLRRDGKKPKHWQSGAWRRYRERWTETLSLADSFLAGEVSDPLPDACHYGGKIDRQRLSPYVWERMETDGFKNDFYKRISGQCVVR